MIYPYHPVVAQNLFYCASSVFLKLPVCLGHENLSMHAVCVGVVCVCGCVGVCVSV